MAHKNLPSHAAGSGYCCPPLAYGPRERARILKGNQRTKKQIDFFCWEEYNNEIMSVPRIGFFLHKVQTMRLFTPLILEAARRGTDVVFFCGPKSDECFVKFPLTRPILGHMDVPGLRENMLVSYDTNDDLLEKIQEKKVTDIFTADFRETAYNQAFHNTLAKEGIRLHVLQWYADYLIMRPELLLARVATVFAHSRRMVDIYNEAYGQEAGSPVEKKFVVVGNPLFDALSDLKPEEIRKKYGIPADKKVVLLMTQNFPFCELEQRWKLVIRIFRFGGWRKLPGILFGPQYRDIIAALRTWCTRENAFLLVKGRTKNYEPPFVLQAADEFLVDRTTWYPPMSLELLSVADVIINMWSTSVLEAAALGVYNVNVRIPLTVEFPQEVARFFEVHDAAGVTESCDYRQFGSYLEKRRLQDFRVDPLAQKKYIDTYVGPMDGQVSARILDTILSR